MRHALRFVLVISLLTVFSALTTTSGAIANGSGSGNITRIWTDFGGSGLWDSTQTGVSPDDAHDLLAFSLGGTTYSTGVDDGVLNSNNVTFTAGTWEALPVEGLTTGSATNYLVALGSEVGGGANLGTLTSEALSEYLVRGTRGLDLASGITNIPVGTLLTFKVPSLTVGSIGDGIPDVLITQIASPNSVVDKLRFVDSSGDLVGNEVSINQTLIDAVGSGSTSATWRARYYLVPSGVLASGFSFPVSGNLRLRAFELEDFGLTADNAADVAELRWAAGGSSDPAFFAYNTSSIDVVGASITVQATTVTLAAIADQAVGDGPVTAVASSANGFAIAFATSDASVCTVNVSGSVTPIAPGICTVTASTAATTVGSTRFTAASASRSFTILAESIPPSSGGSEPTPTFLTRGGLPPLLSVAEAEWQQADGAVLPLAVSTPRPGTVRYQAVGIDITLRGTPATSDVVGLVADRDGNVECEVCAQLAVGSVIEVWMFSEPRLVAAHEITDAPCQRFLIPLGSALDGGGAVAPGAHTLQLALPTGAGLSAVNVGVTAAGPVPVSVPSGGGLVPTSWWLVIVLGGVLLSHAMVESNRRSQVAYVSILPPTRATRPVGTSEAPSRRYPRRRGSAWVYPWVLASLSAWDAVFVVTKSPQDVP